MSFFPIDATSANVAPQQAPAFEHRERAIEAVADLSMAARGADVFDCLQLGIGCPTALTLELDGVDLAAVNGDHVWDACAHAKPFQARCFDRAAITPVCGMEGEDTGRAAHRKMFEHRALDSSSP
jgi:hypothetical protein